MVLNSLYSCNTYNICRNNEDKQLSKTLSWLLRHGAIKEKLKISPEGYISVQDILQHKTCKGKFTLCDIQRVVTTNDKKRFKLRNNPHTNVVEIKAHQGHTIRDIDDSGLTPILEAKYQTVVHGTYHQCWPDIRTQGLSRMRRKHIHLAKGTLGDPNIISGIRKDVQIYVFIDLGKALTDGIKFYESENGVILTEGNENGYLENKYFSKVIQVDTAMEGPAQSSGELKVQVSGYPKYTQPQDLTRVFGSYGAVKVEKVTKRFAVLAFTNEADAKGAINDTNKVNVYGEFLTVQPYTAPTQATRAASKRDFPNSKYKGSIIEPRLIKLTGDFHEQLDNLLDAVRLTQEEVKNLSALYVDLERHLQQQWPGCVALPFGSITTGLGIKSSDADCFIQVPPIFCHPGANYVYKAKRLLQQAPQTFSEILAIPRANTPIVKFFHLPTAVNCDVTFKTPLGARNSKLVAFLLHADPRLIPMAVVIKYWAKVHGISGTGKLTNYALTMLIIFYLQQPEAIIPSVEWLQRDPSNEAIVDNWNTGFTHNHELLPKTKNTSPISELLGGFFKYYSTFDFDNNIVCPLTGCPMAKEQFKDLDSLPPLFERYKNNLLEHLVMPLRFTTAMCVQDPIELSHNVASPISSRLALDIKAYFKFAADAYEKEKENGCTGFLKIILLQIPKLPRKVSSPEYRVVMNPYILQCIGNEDWKSVVREVIMQLFEGMCKIPLTWVQERPIEKVPKKLRESYTGTIVKPIWKRKQFTKLYNLTELSFITKQTRITEEILKVNKESLQLKFELTIIYSTHTRHVSTSIHLIEGDGNLFKEFGQFFISNLKGWFITLLRPYFFANKQENTSNVNGSNTESGDQQREADDRNPGIEAEVVGKEDSDSSSEELADTSDTIKTNDGDANDSSLIVINQIKNIVINDTTRIATSDTNDNDIEETSVIKTST